jgi:hypothetical protein
MRVICSCENKEYLWWQAELLCYTFDLVRMPGEPLILVAKTDEPEREFAGIAVPVSNYKDNVPNEPLVTLNKPGGIAEWATQEDNSYETMLIVDPDTVFVRPVSDVGRIPEGEVYSEEQSYMWPDIPSNETVLKRHCKIATRSRVEPVGIYFMMSFACLRQLAPLWLEKSIDIASDPICRSALAYRGWLSDMWGYAIAAAELGIRHHIMPFSQVTGANDLSCPLIHYCFPLLKKEDGRWEPRTKKEIVWSKWSYKAWSEPPGTHGLTVEGEFLIERLREVVAIKRASSS